MAFERLQFTKSWNNAQDFPTYEPSEAQVRADMQQLHDEARDGLNRLVDALNAPTAAEELPFRPGGGLEAENIRDAVLETYEAVQDAASGLLVDGTVTREKLEETLLARIDGGRPWRSMDAPGAGQGPAQGFPVGQLWLRPAFTVENLAEDGWQTSGCTLQDAQEGWLLTGSGEQAMAGVSQTLTNLGTAGQRVYVSLRTSAADSQLTGLALYCNGAAHDLTQGGGIFEASLDSQGALAVSVTATWPAAALAVGSVTLDRFAVVNADRIEAGLTDCAALSDWPGLMAAALPFQSYPVERAVWIQTAPGQWAQIDYEVLPVDRGGTGLSALASGELLYGGADGTLQRLAAPANDAAALGFTDGAPCWMNVETAVGTLGALRGAQGTYTGNEATRSIQMPATPLLVVIGCTSARENPIVLCQGSSHSASYQCPKEESGTSMNPFFKAGVTLSGKTLSFWTDATSNLVALGATTRHYNTSGASYRWAAVY